MYILIMISKNKSPFKIYSHFGYENKIYTQLTSRRCMLYWIQKPSFSSEQHTIPGISMFMERHSTFRCPKKKYTIIYTILNLNQKIYCIYYRIIYLQLQLTDVCDIILPLPFLLSVLLFIFIKSSLLFHLLSLYLQCSCSF